MMFKLVGKLVVLSIWVLGLVCVPADGLHYQGRISVDGRAFTGVGIFRFALVSADRTQTFWSNASLDGNGVPILGVTLSLQDGYYATLLGNTNLVNMSELNIGSLGEDALYLRVWFDDGVEKMGADTMRWLYASCLPEKNLLFGYGTDQGSSQKSSRQDTTSSNTLYRS